MRTETQTSYTPGPWEVGPHAIDVRTVNAESDPGNARVVANMVQVDGDIETIEANARLIAAAPELLAALKAAQALAHYKKEWELYSQWGSLIAKAEGPSEGHTEPEEICEICKR